MIYAKTVCSNPGSYVEIVPVGLLIRLQYNASGMLQEVQHASVNAEGGTSWEKLSTACYHNLSDHVPIKVNVTQGTTWVEGVLYFGSISYASGELPYCMSEDYIRRIEDGDINYQFYAGYAESLAISFTGALAIRNWLSLNKFMLLPGTVVPTDLNEDTINLLMVTGNYNFQYPYIGGYYVFDNTDSCEFVSSGLMQCKINDVSTFEDSDGYVHGSVKTDLGDLVFNYPDVVANNLQKDLYMLYFQAEYTEILTTRTSGAAHKILPKEYKCRFCHKTLQVPLHGVLQCDDPHCMSLQYPEVVRILNTFHLPILVYDKYVEYVNSEDLITATDVLLLPEYKELKVSGTLSDVLRAAIPFNVCPNMAFIDKFVRCCGGSFATLKYYLNNPQRIVTELEVESAEAKRFISWASDPYNVSTVLTLLSSVTVVENELKLDVAPIFRGRKISLTGDFKRGNFSKISHILEAYGARVLTSLDETELPHILITGSTDEHISGKDVKFAMHHHIPVVTEDEFFVRYEIDADLRSQNLL